MSPFLIAALVLGALVVSYLVTYWLIGRLAEGGVMDRPNERSSHTVPTPRGGGLGILAGAVPAWLAILIYGGSIMLLFTPFLGLVLLAVTSWWDDRKGLSWGTRLHVQCVALLLGLGPLLILAAWHGSSFGVGAFLLALGALLIVGALWLCFMNAFNFMDGIDGIAAVHAIAIAGGVALSFAWHRGDSTVIAGALVLIAAVLGFLAWNRPPARIFMGDVGSIPLGFVLGFLLICLFSLQVWQIPTWGAVLTLPAYVGADTLLTFIRRLRRGERVTEAHREHAYQRASGREKSGHARVLWRVALAHAALIGAVMLGFVIGGNGGQVVTVALGAVIVGGLLFELERLAARPATA